jgi:hypothetical protein
MTAEPRFHLDVQRARSAIVEAELARRASDRFLAAHQAALRVAAIILATRTHPALANRRSRPRNAWRTVAEVAPEFAEWAAFFAATEAKRDAVRAGATAIVTAREADDLVRDAQTFLTLVEQAAHRSAASRPTRLVEG